MKRSQDLDVDSPDKIVDVLRNASEAAYEASNELESAWQEKEYNWKMIGRELERAADKIEKNLKY